MQILSCRRSHCSVCILLDISKLFQPVFNQAGYQIVGNRSSDALFVFTLKAKRTCRVFGFLIVKPEEKQNPYSSQEKVVDIHRTLMTLKVINLFRMVLNCIVLILQF